MIATCTECGTWFDDAQQVTICPHTFLATADARNISNPGNHVPVYPVPA